MVETPCASAWLDFCPCQTQSKGVGKNQLPAETTDPVEPMLSAWKMETGPPAGALQDIRGTLTPSVRRVSVNTTMSVLIHWPASISNARIPVLGHVVLELSARFVTTDLSVHVLKATQEILLYHAGNVLWLVLGRNLGQSPETSS